MDFETLELFCNQILISRKIISFSLRCVELCLPSVRAMLNHFVLWVRPDYLSILLHSVSLSSCTNMSALILILSFDILCNDRKFLHLY